MERKRGIVAFLFLDEKVYNFVWIFYIINVNNVVHENPYEVSMIKSFSYTNAKVHTTVRICNVVHESPTEYRGFDYNKMTRAEQELVNKIYPNDHKPTPVPTEYHKVSELNYEQLGIPKELFTKAYRVFKKCKCF